MSYLPQTSLKLSLRPCMYGITLYALDLLLLFLLLFFVVIAVAAIVIVVIAPAAVAGGISMEKFYSILSNTHVGVLALCKDFLDVLYFSFG